MEKVVRNLKIKEIGMIELSSEEHLHISARNSNACIDYVLQNRGNSGLIELFNNILSPSDSSNPMYLKSSCYCFYGKPIDLEFFQDIDNWYSNDISLQMFENVVGMGIDPFDIGVHTIRQAAKTNNFVVTGIIKALGPYKMVLRIANINALYNKTKISSAVAFGDDHVFVDIKYCKGITHSPAITRQNIGAYIAGLKLVGLRNAKHEVLFDDFSSDHGFTKIKFSWKKESLRFRIKMHWGRIVANLLAKTYLRSHDVIQRFHHELVNSLHQEIEKKEALSRKNEKYYQAMITAQQEQTGLLEQEVKKKTAELHQALDDKQQLFNDFSHEVRTPLMLAINPIERVQALILDPNCQSLLGTARTNLEDLKIMFKQLYRLEQIKQKKSEVSSFDLARIANHVIESLRHLANDLGIMIKSEIPSSQFVEVQSGSIELILKNLLENALKYCAVGDEVCLSVAAANENRLCFVVEDTGPGIPAAHREKVFHRFHRVPGVENIRGSGIGLAIVKQWVEGNDGEISCTASKTGGARFEISLVKSNIEPDNNVSLVEIDSVPLVTCKRGRSELTGSNPETAINMPTILLVEDNLQLREYLANLFNESFNCLQAEDGEAAWKLVLSQQPDLIVSDVMMPNLNGYELTKRIKSNLATSHIPVILLTAKGDTESELVGLKVKADDYLGKPIDDAVILQKINNVLSQQQRLINHIKNQVERGSSVAEYLNETQEKWKIQLDEYLEQCYSDESLTIGDIAKSLAMSERKLQTMFKQTMGVTPVAYRNVFRLNKAKQKLTEDPNRTITSVAMDCGFASIQTFSKKFTAQFGINPVEYKGSG